MSQENSSSVIPDKHKESIIQSASSRRVSRPGTGRQVRIILFVLIIIAVAIAAGADQRNSAVRRQQGVQRSSRKHQADAIESRMNFAAQPRIAAGLQQHDCVGGTAKGFPLCFIDKCQSPRGSE